MLTGVIVADAEDDETVPDAKVVAESVGADSTACAPTERVADAEAVIPGAFISYTSTPKVSALAPLVGTDSAESPVPEAEPLVKDVEEGTADELESNAAAASVVALPVGKTDVELAEAVGYADKDASYAANVELTEADAVYGSETEADGVGSADVEGSNAAAEAPTTLPVAEAADVYGALPIEAAEDEAKSYDPAAEADGAMLPVAEGTANVDEKSLEVEENSENPKPAAETLEAELVAETVSDDEDGVVVGYA